MQSPGHPNYLNLIVPHSRLSPSVKPFHCCFFHLPHPLHRGKSCRLMACSQKHIAIPSDSSYFLKHLKELIINRLRLTWPLHQNFSLLLFQSQPLPPSLCNLLSQLKSLSSCLNFSCLLHKLMGDRLASSQSLLHLLARVRHGCHVAVQRLHPVLDRPEGIQEVLVDLQVPPLNLSPKVAPCLHVVLSEKAGELLQRINSIFIIFKPGIKNLFELSGQHSVSLRITTLILRHLSQLSCRSESSNKSL